MLAIINLGNVEMNLVKLLLPALIVISFGCTKTETVEKPVVVEVPTVKTVEVATPIPGTNEVIEVPEVVIVDKGLGIQSLPIDISKASSKLQKLARAVGKVMSVNGSSGSGFFISADGLFLTNEHVLPRASCTSYGCPGFKIVHGFTKNGKPKVYSKFKVLSQDNGNKEYDFTLVKVDLADGEKVAFLPIEMDEAQYAFSKTTEGDRYKALGHPGGATLKFANGRPYMKMGPNVEFQGLVIPGNSGGPMVDLKTGKVIGLIKNTRTGFQRTKENSAEHYTYNRATAMIDLVKLFKKELPSEITSLIPDLDEISASGERSGIYSPAANAPEPDLDIFLGALRRSFGDMKLREALSQLDLYIGTETETEILDLMTRKTEYTHRDLQIDSLNKLFQKQVSIGRNLRFSNAAREKIEAVLTLKSGEETSPKITANILFNYFDNERRQAFQNQCISSFPQAPAVASALVYLCATVKGWNEASLPQMALSFFKEAPFKELDDFGQVTGFLMFIGVIGTKDSSELEAIGKINDFIDQRVSDVEFLMQNDSYSMNIIQGLVGVGSFRETFPN